MVSYSTITQIIGNLQYIAGYKELLHGGTQWKGKCSDYFYFRGFPLANAQLIVIEG